MKIVPSDDPDMIYFEQFSQKFGEDANVFVIGIKDSAIYQLDNFNQLASLTKRIKQIEGIKDVLSLPDLFYLEANKKEKRFVATPLFKNPPSSQTELDSLVKFANSLDKSITCS